MSALLPCIEIDPSGKPEAVIIGLHGIGADGYDLEPLAAQLRLETERAVRFVFPHAPKREITLHGGIPSRAWFDILDGGWPRLEREVDLNGIAASRNQVEGLIRREVEAGIPPERMALLGFSQGGVIALDAALRRAEPLAGVLALSTYLPTMADLSETATAEARRTPIFMAHGTEDPVVPMESGQLARDGLTNLGCPVDWHEYRMVHSICVDEIEDMRQWLFRTI
ncbi:MAG: alpha/beta hydrolase [Desulfococcaceae bacterium]